ncbi:hypothetical protein SO694_00006163 [Aureococcus anophagefferens]|uniref:HSF-type DNA-binding domain-containing protein n=1 Tax=Aureococcus anophagefferens TaxID=44056 RepID=A0ABR1G9Q1_AURAN
MSDALSRLTQVLNELQDTGGLTANLKISRSGDLEIVVTNSDTSPVTPSAPAAPSPPPPPAPQAEVPPGVRDAPRPRAPAARGAAAPGGRETPDGRRDPARPAGGAPPPPPGAPGAAEASKPVSSDVARALALAIARAYSPADLLRHLPAGVLLEAVRLQRSLVGDPAEAAAPPEPAAPPPEPAAPPPEPARRRPPERAPRPAGGPAAQDLEPGDRFFDVTALYVDGAAKKPGEGDCAAPRDGRATGRHTCGQGRSAGGGSYLPIDNSVYYELKAGPTHALTYFFNEDRRGDDCDAKVRLQHTHACAAGGWVLEWRVLERLRAGDELLVDYPETDDGVKHATWPAKPPAAEKRWRAGRARAPGPSSRGRKVFAPASIEDSSSDDDDGGGGETAAAAPAGHEDAAALLALFAPRRRARAAEEEEPVGARRPAPPRVYKSRAEPPPPNPSNPWGLKRPPSVRCVPLSSVVSRTLKLICEDPKNAAIVTWCPKAREISVVDKPTFITDVLPRYFRSNVASGRQAGAVGDDTATAHFDGVHSRQFDSFVRQLNYYGFRKARRCTNRYVCMDYSIKSPASSTA